MSVSQMHLPASVEIEGVGLGFRRDLVDFFSARTTTEISFVEVAPENWMDVGGHWGKVFDAVIERFPLTCHGLSLSLGSIEPLDSEFLQALKLFLNRSNAQIYSEHLSYTKTQNAHLHELLPIPFREDAVRHVAERIKHVQDVLERRIAIENVSYYTAVAPEMDEASFIRAILEEADCHLLLDVNNVYVNAFNHGYDAKSFIEKLPLERVAIIHMAGHEQRDPTLIIDTHGAAIVDPVYELFAWTLARLKPVPVLLERDFNFPEQAELLGEVATLRQIMFDAWETRDVAFG